ncbi:MAG: hypothetical protein AB1489_43235, partial [Acidobacteriota bacterium]
MKYERGKTPRNFRVMFLIPFVIILFYIPANAQSPSPASSPNLSSILSNEAEKVLTNCGCWPPKVAAKEKDRTKQLKDLEDAKAVLIGALAQSLEINQTISPVTYEGSLLRLLDNVNLFQPKASNVELFGIALNLEPSRLQLWGLSKFMIKHDCLSLLGLLGKAKAN